MRRLALEERRIALQERQMEVIPNLSAPPVLCQSSPDCKTPSKESDTRQPSSSSWGVDDTQAGVEGDKLGTKDLWILAGIEKMKAS